METELTLAARSSVENANQIMGNQKEFDEKDFKKENKTSNKKKVDSIRKNRKNERNRKKQGKRKK